MADFFINFEFLKHSKISSLIYATESRTLKYNHINFPFLIYTFCDLE